MDIANHIETAILIVPIVLAFSNWALSLFFARKSTNYLALDLKQLWPDSLPFLKAQWPIITVTLAAATWSQLHPIPDLSDKPELALEVFLSTFGSSGILWILNLFYVSYLAAPKYPGRVATIGAWGLVMYIITDMAIVTFGALGTILFVAPGLIIFTRSCLFLPVYAIHGHKPLSAIRQSWALTKGNYWLVSRYIGLPILVMMALYCYPELVTNFMPAGTQDAIKNCLPLDAAFTSAAQVLNIAIGGLLYKLYERLSTAGTISID